MLTFDGWLTLIVLVLTFVALVKEFIGPDIVMFGALVVLWAGGVIDSTEATAGFANAQVLTVGLLFVVAAAVKQTGALRHIQRIMVGSPSPRFAALARLLVPTAALSSFLNNTPIVAMFTPIVRDWAHKHKLPPSKFLIPLSYAAILGGTCTLIGTSTNLVVSGLLEERGMPPLGMFELSAVGVPAAICGLLYLTTVGQHLLPDRRAPDSADAAESRRYSVSVHVLQNYAFRGKTVEQAGLRHLEGLYLVEIRRKKRRIFPVRPTDVIRVDDHLILYGAPETVVGLLETEGFEVDANTERDDANSPHRPHVHEIVLKDKSELVGSTLRENNFRRKYDAAVIGIYRDGSRLKKKLGDVRLRAYDTLLVQAAAGFRRTWGNTRDFYLLSDTDPHANPVKTGFSIITLVAMIAMMGTGLISPLLAVAVAAIAMIVTRCIEPAEARRSVDLSVLLVIASSFGVSNAVEKSGLAQLAADAVEASVGDAAPWIAICVVYLLCNITTEMLSNNAAAALSLPIALSVAETLEVDPRPFAIAICIAASLSFVTPLGYQTNLLVYGPGGYRFSDYTKVGLPLSVICFVVTMVAMVVIFDL